MSSWPTTAATPAQGCGPRSTTLERYDGRVDPVVAERLRRAATHEVGHLEHLLTRTPTTPCERFDVPAVVDEIAESARTLGACVDVEASGARVWGRGRSRDLAAVLKQLLCNAATHAPGSTVSVRVTTGAEVVTVTCSDDGPGLDPGLGSRVFERGVRAATSPGSGLGLYAARQLMREQDGDLALGDEGLGACFVMTLPVSAAAPAPAPAPAALVPAGATPR